jgi:hypothetical protein
VRRNGSTVQGDDHSRMAFALTAEQIAAAAAHWPALRYVSLSVADGKCSAALLALSQSCARLRECDLLANAGTHLFSSHSVRTAVAGDVQAVLAAKRAGQRAKRPYGRSIPTGCRDTSRVERAEGGDRAEGLGDKTTAGDTWTSSDSGPVGLLRWPDAVGFARRLRVLLIERMDDESFWRRRLLQCPRLQYYSQRNAIEYDVADLYAACPALRSQRPTFGRRGTCSMRIRPDKEPCEEGDDVVGGDGQRSNPTGGAQRTKQPNVRSTPTGGGGAIDKKRTTTAAATTTSVRAKCLILDPSAEPQLEALLSWWPRVTKLVFDAHVPAHLIAIVAAHADAGRLRRLGCFSACTDFLSLPRPEGTTAPPLPRDSPAWDMRTYVDLARACASRLVSVCLAPARRQQLEAARLRIANQVPESRAEWSA